MSLGSALTAFGGKGKTKTTSSVKNPALQQWIDTSISGFGSLRDTGQKALEDYISKFYSGTGAAKTRSEEEIASISPFYTGEFGNRLDQLAREEEASRRAMADFGAASATRLWKGARAGSDGGLSSYDRRSIAGTLAPLYSQVAADAAARRFSNLDYLTRLQQGNLGRRQSLWDAWAARDMMPAEARYGLGGRELAYLSALGELDRGNKFYGLEYKPSLTERMAYGHDKDMAQAQNMMAIARGVSPTVQRPTADYGFSGGNLTGAQELAFNSGGGPVTGAGATDYLSSIWNAGGDGGFSSSGLW